MSGDPYATLETPEALDRAMRLVHARRGADDVYKLELARVFAEVYAESGVELSDEVPSEYEVAHWRACQLVHALVRISSVTALNASTMSGAMKMSPIDVLQLVDDALRAEDDEEPAA